MHKTYTHVFFSRFLLAALSTALLSCSSAHDGLDGGSTEPPEDGNVRTEDAARPLDAGRADPDAGGPRCDPGATRTADCGFCGTQAQMCEPPGTWTATSECLGQRECEAGAVETRDGELCVREQRICLDGCTWTDWEEVRAPGPCEPGDTRRVAHSSCSESERLLEQCGTDCQWEEGVGTCVDACGGPPARTTPEWAREVCIPDGEFIRGLNGTMFSPEATIYLSSFYIDVYPVTNRRYQQCVDAGVCAPADGTYARSDAEFLDYPVQGTSRMEAEAFCAWDGGRRFVTAAEWQKAARGPAPRRNIYPWGDTIDCAIVNVAGPPCNEDPYGLHAMDPFDAFPSTSASYYGVHMMGFGVSEWVFDAYCLNWYSEPESTVPNPLCDPSKADGSQWLRVSFTRRAVTEVFYTARHAYFQNIDGSPTSFRCGRDS